jgi:proliferating cell nuclear antigen
MKFTIEDKKKKENFISIFHILKSSSSQINASFDKSRLHIQGMDKSHVCLFDLNLTDKWFNSYEVNDKEEFCFDTNIFYSIISIKSDEQSLIIKKDSPDSLSIELTSGTKKSDFNKFFTMPLLEYEYDEMNIPSTDFDAEFSLPSKKVTDMLSQLSNFGDDISIKCSEDYVDFKTNGTSGEMRVNIPIDDMSSYAVIEGEEVNISYSLLYINKLCITNKISVDIEFSVSKECPMKINYNLGDDSSLMFYIAPKLSDD